MYASEGNPVSIRVFEEALRHIKNVRFKRFLIRAIEKSYRGDYADLIYASNLRQFPVDVEEFVLGEDYLGASGVLYPVVLENLIALNGGDYEEAILTGGIGSGKTTLALYTQLYQLYCLSCMVSPQKAFGLDPHSEILIVFQSLNSTIAKDLDYSRFRSMVSKSPYFKTHFPFSKDLESKLAFPNRVYALPLSGSPTAALGQNIFGGLIDECETFDSLVLMCDSTTKPLYTIVPGDKVWGVLDGELIEDEVVVSRHTGCKPVLTVRLDNGMVVEATSNHPFMTTEGWTTARNLKPGMGVYCTRESHVRGSRSEGQGIIGRETPIAINCTDGESREVPCTVCLRKGGCGGSALCGGKWAGTDNSPGFLSGDHERFDPAGGKGSASVSGILHEVDGCRTVRQRAGLELPNLGRAKVVSVRLENLRAVPVWNLETKHSHTYIAEGAVVHNCNYMAVIKNSAMTVDGGTFDQAQHLYSILATRRKSRFSSGGRLPGILCLSSSRHYPGEFTDVKEAEARKELLETGKTSIFVYDMRVWDVVPDRFCGEKLRVFVGNETHRPRLLESTENVSDDLVIEVPVEFKTDFQRDITRSLRDIAGVATLAKLPFILWPEKIAQAMSCGLTNLANLPTVDFVDTLLVLDDSYLRNPKAKRYAHIDLGLSSDSAGLVMGHVESFVHVQRGNEVEVLPKIVIDLVLEVAPPRGGEIRFEKIREVLYALKTKLNIPLLWVSMDTYQSVDTLQILASRGFRVGNLSTDTSMVP